jgi:hypothetical protein
MARSYDLPLITVRLTSSDAKAVLPANCTFTAADAGKHTFSVTLKTAGTRSITVADTLNSVFRPPSVASP